MSRTISKIGSNLVWKSGFCSIIPYCTCGQKLDYRYEGDRDNYCRRCGAQVEWYDPDDLFLKEGM